MKSMEGPKHPNTAPSDEDVAIQEAMSRGEFFTALELLVQQHQDAIVRYCSCHLSDGEMAQEIAQEVFLAAFEGMARFRGDASVKTWLYNIAANKCLEAKRTHTRRMILAQDNEDVILEHTHCAPTPPPEELCQQARQRQLVWQALQRLRLQERDLLILRYLEEFTYAEIGAILRISSRTVERRLPQAEAKFHRAYTRCQNGPWFRRRHTKAKPQSMQRVLAGI